MGLTGLSRFAPLGAVFRSVGSALESIGAGIATDTTRDTLSRHREVMAVGAKFPKVAASCFVAPSANVMGNVSIGDYSSVWYGAIIRGDPSSVSIGRRSSIADKAMLSGKTSIGSGVFVGMGAVITSATIQDNATIGMAATIGEGATVEAGAYVAPGAVVAPGMTVGAGQVVAGAPATLLRTVTPEESAAMARSVEAYVQLSAIHSAEACKEFLEIEQDKSDKKWRDERTEDGDSALGLLEKNPRAQVW